MFATIKNRSRSLRAGLALVAALGTAGCFYDETDLTQTRPLVEWQSHSHRVSFDEGDSRLSPDARAALDAFIARQGDGQQVTIMVGQEADSQRAELQRARASGLAAYLRARRVDVAQVTALPGTAYRNSAVVSTARLSVRTPNCPDWRRVQQGGTMIGDRSQFGCVTAAALGSMVANPQDLIRGRDMGPADGPAMSRGVREYRSGTLGQNQRNQQFSTDN